MAKDIAFGTDARGTDAYNDDLSKRRVVNVAKYAVDHGVNPEQLELSYEGKNDPVATNATDQEERSADPKRERRRPRAGAGPSIRRGAWPGRTRVNAKGLTAR